MGKKQNYCDIDEFGNEIGVYRPRKGKDETLHIEITNPQAFGESVTTCLNLDFISANELAEVLVEFAARLKIKPFPCCSDEDWEYCPGQGVCPIGSCSCTPAPVPLADSTCTVDGCLCKADKVEPKVEPWGKGWDNQWPWSAEWYKMPQTINTSDNQPTVFGVHI